MSGASGTQNFPYTLWTLFDYNGKIAVYYGSSLSAEEPIKTVEFKVSNTLTRDYPWLVGKTPWSAGRSWPSGIVTNPNGGQTYIDSESWPKESVQIPIPAPRDGKMYTWRWSDFSREWVKDWYPTCGECRQLHKPGLLHCDWCGIATPKLSKSNYCSGCERTRAA